ncbi:DUF4882 family protein [Acinetobacter sp. V110_1]|uniref:DUF4882 family protein n=1 Tax=unclassified Acinetobacter TaxID=196816 RepID=UPI00287DBE09|nr:DUF4882 family protein [Acinetobacter sp. V110_1]MDS7944773.1 DUF4882 family protein [Acinetobacter sp. V110_1]
MKKIGIVAVSAITLCWAMYEVSSDKTNTTLRNEPGQKVTPKKVTANTNNEKLATQMLLAQTNSLNSAPVCQYNFDATQEDYDLWNSEHSDELPMKKFPLIEGQKFGFKINPIAEDNYDYLAYIAKSKAKLTSKSEMGDFLLPQTGIIALEMELKVPTIAPGSSSFGNSSYISHITFTGTTNNNYTISSFYNFNIGTYDPDFGENPASLNYYLTSRVSDNNGPTNMYYKNKNMVNNSNEYQRLGIYINQDTKKVGFIFNGVDEGYQFTLPSTLQNAGFTLYESVGIFSTNFFGQELTAELITDRNALQFNYPQGTTDICGNAI